MVVVLSQCSKERDSATPILVRFHYILFTCSVFVFEFVFL